MSERPGPIRRLAHWLANVPHLVMISTGVFLLIIGMAGALIYQDAFLVRDLISNEFNRQQLILARQAAFQIDDGLRDIEREMAELQHAIGTGEESLHTHAVEAAMRRTASKGLVELALVDPNGHVRFRRHVDRIEPLTPERIRAELQADGSQEMWLPPLREERDLHGRTMVTSTFFARPTTSTASSLLLMARLDASDLAARVAREIRSGMTGYAWVIDEEGRFLFHPTESFIGQPATEARARRSRQESGSEPLTFTEINRIMKVRMLRGQEGTGSYVSGWHRGKRGRIVKLIAFAPIESKTLTFGHAWSVAVVAPIEEVAEALGDMYVRHYAAGGAVVMGVLIFGLLLAVYQLRVSQALKHQVELTQASLHETERIYRRIVEQATDLIYIFDLDRRIVLLNSQAMWVFSHLVITESQGGILPDGTNPNREEVFIGRTINELMRRPDGEFMDEKIDRVLSSKESITYEHSIPIGKRKVRLSTRLVPVRDERGEIQYLLGISRDITEQREMERRIYNTEKLASIGTLAAGVAHEINNPLAVILGFTEMLAERFKEGSSEREDLEIIESNANNAKKIVENLLTFARVTEGMEDTLDVTRAVEAVLKVAHSTISKKDIEVRTDLAENLPRVRGDSREFQQVVFNLINNAVAAMEDNGGGVLSLSTAREGDWVRLTVRDTGTGIPERIQDQIYDPFFTTKKVGEGTGLGLSLCYGIVRKYGGKMSFSSVAEEDVPDGPTGTTFVVSMPVDRTDRPTQGIA